MYENLNIKKQGTKITKEFLEKHDELTKGGASICNGHCYGLYDEKDKQVGVAVFHMVSAWQTVKGCFALENGEQKGFWELGRLAMDEAHDTNDCKSWFLEECIELFTSEVNVRAVFAYINPEIETGDYLSLVGFKCYGLTSERNDFYVKQGDGTYKKQSRGKTSGKEGIWQPRPRKKRHLLVMDNNLQTKWIEEPNPEN